MYQINESDTTRLWSKVDRSGGSTQCWIWLAAKNKQGYGVIWMGLKIFLAHRISFEIANGSIPNGLFVLHHCDNPACVNPAHLFLGTQKDNMHDMEDKGRKIVSIMKGEMNGFSKLSDSQVAEIRQRFFAGEAKRKLAREFGVSHTHIGRIVNYTNRSP